MLRGLLGKAKDKTATEKTAASPASSKPANEPGVPRIAPSPWDGKPDAAACNFAVAQLFSNIPARLTTNGSVHAETCLTAIGAIAGFAAQRALFARLRETKDEAVLRQMHTIKTPSGKEYFFGEPLNRMLVSTSEAENNQRLWSLAASTAVNAGFAPAELPVLGDLFAHVANTLGGRKEGRPSVKAEHQPQRPAGELLRTMWPLALMCLAGRFPKADREFGVASIEHWPAISARAASALMLKMPATLDKRTALTLVMEAAIYGSKVSPAALSKAGARPAGTSLH